MKRFFSIMLLIAASLTLHAQNNSIEIIVPGLSGSNYPVDFAKRFSGVERDSMFNGFKKVKVDIKKVISENDTLEVIQNFKRITFFVSGIELPEKIQGRNLRSRMLYPGNEIGVFFKENTQILYAEGKMHVRKTMIRGTKKLVQYDSISNYQLRTKGNVDGTMVDQEIKIPLSNNLEHLDALELVWGGDLNNDGYLDLVIHNRYQQKGGVIYLLMASKESKGILNVVSRNEISYE